MADTAAPIPAPPVQPYDELLKHLGLSREDLRRLQHENISVMELMTEHLRPIACAKEIERQANIESEWKSYQEDLQEAQKNGTEPPTWYYGDGDPHDKLTETEALENLAFEVSQGVFAHNDLSMCKAYELTIKDELPEWMTWDLLESWSNQIRLSRQLRLHKKTPPPIDD